MIDRVLDRQTVLATARATLEQLESPAAAVELDKADGVSAEELAAELREAIDRQSEIEPRSVDDRKAYLPADPIISTVQTAMEDYLRSEHAELLKPSPERTGPGGPAATAFYTGVDDIWRDAKMVWNVVKALKRRMQRGCHPFVESKPPVEFKLAENARIVLVGDWGLGNTSATTIAGLIGGELVDAGNREAHVIHLGDVYYSGEEKESQEKVLDLWPIAPGDQNRWSWSLNANHDMYSGGWGYFDKILADPRFAKQRTADGRGVSYFMLRSKHWQFLALDTAWTIHGRLGHHGEIADVQANWVLDCVKAPQGRRTVLLSHHQFYSEDQVRGNLAAKLKPVMNAGGVDAWFWGHEHICRRFARTTDVRYPACVGHGAMPHSVDGVAQEPGGWEYDEGEPDGDGDEWRWCGYAVLDLNGTGIDVRYVDEQGNSHHPESLPV